MTIRLQPLGALLLLCLGLACQSALKPAIAPGAAPVTTPQPAAEPQQDATERLLAAARQDNRAMKHLYYLSKDIGPRLTGSTNYDRAAQWCLEQFQSWGLSARLETWGEFPVRCDRGVQRGREVKPKARELSILTRAWTMGTNGPVRGRAVLEPVDDAEFEAQKAGFAGAWLLRRSGRTLSALRKALASAAPAGFVSSSGGELISMSGVHGRSLDEIQKQVPPEIVLRGDQFDELKSRVAAGEEVELEFEAENRLSAGPFPCTNVVADIVGSEFPDEYVIVGAHLDTWDGAEGAQDNGTGVASTLEAARLIAGLGVKPRRTLRFVLFGGEEQELLGSAGYVKAHASELPNISAVLVHDWGASPLAGLDVTYPMLADVQSVLAPLAGLDRIRPVSVNERLGLVNSGDSDHASFLDQNLAPAFFWNQSGAGYKHVHHTQYDTFETVAPDDEEHNARVVAVAAFGLAQLDHLLVRTDMAPLEPRRIGAAFTDAIVQEVLPEGRANMAGWQEGDVLLSVDGVEVEDREDIVRAINHGGPRKTIRLRRGSEVIDTELDWSNDPDEPERSARAGRREAWLKAHARSAAGS